MGKKCDDVGKEILKKGEVNGEMHKKCEDVNKRKAKNYKYGSHKFGFSRVVWTIRNYCVISPLKDKIFYLPEFYVRGTCITRWEINVERFFNNRGYYDVFFHMKRLKCPPFRGIVVADCVIHYTEHDGIDLTVEFNHTFGVDNESKTLLKYAGITPIQDYHVPNFKLKLEILVYVDGETETNIPLCERLEVRRLSENLGDLYEDGTMSDLVLKTGDNKIMPVHKCILLGRIKKSEFTDKIASEERLIELDDEVLYDSMEKVIKFLYTGNLNFTVRPHPSIAVYKIAEWLDIEPIISYYNPEETTLTSDSDAEEFSATWTIEDFCSKDDSFLQSPIMTNKMMDTKWQIIVHPKIVQNEENYLEISLVYQIFEVSKHICVELFLQSGHNRSQTYRCHRQISCDGKLKANKFIKLDEVINKYMRDDSLTIGVRLRMSSGQNKVPVWGGSKADCKSLSEQKNYDRLSDDILSLYQEGKHCDLSRYLHSHNITLNVHECILLVRCVGLFDPLKRNNLELFNRDRDHINYSIIIEIMNFVYRGKLDERSPLEKTLILYDAAERFSYVHLQQIIEEKLQEILSPINAERIYEFAVAQDIPDLQHSALDFMRL